MNGDPCMPMSVGALREDAARTTQQYRDRARSVDQEFYGPGGMQRTMYDLGGIQDARSAMSEWTPFLQALHNNGVGRMRSFPQTQVMGPTNQMGARGGATMPQSVAPFADLEGGPTLNLDVPRVNMNRREPMPQGGRNGRTK